MWDWGLGQLKVFTNKTSSDGTWLPATQISKQHLLYKSINLLFVSRDHCCCVLLGVLCSYLCVCVQVRVCVYCVRARKGRSALLSFASGLQDPLKWKALLSEDCRRKSPSWWTAYHFHCSPLPISGVAMGLSHETKWERSTETYTTICKIDSPWEVSCLVQGAQPSALGPLQGQDRVGAGRKVQEGEDWTADSCWRTQKPTQHCKAIILQIKINTFKSLSRETWSIHPCTRIFSLSMWLVLASGLWAEVTMSLNSPKRRSIPGLHLNHC